MEVKRKNVIWRIIKCLILLGVFTLAFVLSWKIGLTAVVFYGIGWFMGYFNKVTKILSDFATNVNAEEMKEVIDGKAFVNATSDGNGNIKVTVEKEPKLKSHKKKIKKENKE